MKLADKMAKFQPMSNTGSFIRRFSFSFSIAGLLLLITSFVSVREALTEDVFKYTNQFRRSRRLPALEMRDDLNAIARKHSEDMAKGRCSFGHSGFNRRESQVEKLITPFSGMGENVAYGANSGKEVVTMWKNSSIHRRNMLGNYKFIGIGTARDKRGFIYYTQIFVR